MKLVIDHLTSITDWVVNSPSTIAEQEFTDYIAGLNAKSLLLKFSANDLTKTATKVFATPFDVSNYENLVFSIWSQGKKQQEYKKASDFSYKIKINDTEEYYLPVYETMTDIIIGIEDVTQITQIQITALHTDTDYIVISEMIAEKEEPGLDILIALKEYIDYLINIEYGNGINIGTISGSAGDKFINIPGDPAYIERYGVIKIVEGANEESHQIQDCDGDNFYFNTNYDGDTLVNNFTSGTVYLTYPSYINPGEMDIRLPGMAIWGIDPDPILTDGKLYTKFDTFSVTDDNFKQRQIGQILNYDILIDLEAYQVSLLENMTKVIRKLIARMFLWINGRRHYIEFTGKPIEQKPSAGIDIIPKIQYSMSVQLRENINDRITVPKTETINLLVNINE